MSATCPTESSSAGSVWIEEKAAQKTPITLLQEMCSKKGITPQYELLSSEGYVSQSVIHVYIP